VIKVGCRISTEINGKNIGNTVGSVEFSQANLYKKLLIT